MNIIDKLDKKISDKKNKKRLKEEEERLEYEKTQKLFKPISNFGTDVYKKNLADDFVKLEKLVKKHTQNLKDITIDSLSFNSNFLELELNSPETIKQKLVSRNL